MDTATDDFFLSSRESQDSQNRNHEPIVTLGSKPYIQDIDDKFLRDFLDSKYQNKLGADT